jgi:hypothetical protein
VDLPAYAALHRHVLHDVLARLDRTYRAFFPRVGNGEQPGFPRFRGRNGWHTPAPIRSTAMALAARTAVWCSRRSGASPYAGLARLTGPARPLLSPRRRTAGTSAARALRYSQSHYHSPVLRRVLMWDSRCSSSRRTGRSWKIRGTVGNPSARSRDQERAKAVILAHEGEPPTQESGATVRQAPSAGS